jgi:hypothetical protein
LLQPPRSARHACARQRDLAWSLIVAAALFPILWLAGRVMRPIGQMLRALSSTVASYRGRFQFVAGGAARR